LSGMVRSVEEERKGRTGEGSLREKKTRIDVDPRERERGKLSPLRFHKLPRDKEILRSGKGGRNFTEGLR